MVNTLNNEAEAINNALKSDAPIMAPALSTSVTLLRGVQTPLTGDWNMECNVRELTGEDEEWLASNDVKKGMSYSEYMSALLKRSVVSIGNINVSETPDVIDELIIGDRDLLFLGTIKATYGRYRELQAVCGSCSESNDIKVDIDTDFKVDKPSKDIHKPLEITMRDGSVLTARYVTGGDSQIVTKRAKTTAEQNTLMLSRCVNVDVEDKEKWARSLNLADRNKLVKALLDNQPGPRMEEVKTQCAHCGEEMTLALDWVSLLFG